VIYTVGVRRVSGHLTEVVDGLNIRRIQQIGSGFGTEIKEIPWCRLWVLRPQMVRPRMGAPEAAVHL